MGGTPLYLPRQYLLAALHLLSKKLVTVPPLSKKFVTVPPCRSAFILWKIHSRRRRDAPGGEFFHRRAASGFDFGTSPHGLAANFREAIRKLVARDAFSPLAKPVSGFEFGGVL